MIAKGGDENVLKLDCGDARTILWIRWKLVNCTRDGWISWHANWTWVKVPSHRPGLPAALGEPGPSPPPGPQLSSAAGGLPTASTPGPKAAGPWRPGCRGGPLRAGQGHGLGSLQGVPALIPTLAVETRTDRKAPAPASWEEHDDWPGRGQQLRRALRSGCPGKASPARRGGAETCPTQGSAVPTALHAAPTDRGGEGRAGEGGWASRTQGWAQLCPPPTPCWGVGGPPASLSTYPAHTPPRGKGWRQRHVPPRREGPDHRRASVSLGAPRPPALMARAHLVFPNWVWQHRGFWVGMPPPTKSIPQGQSQAL